MWKRDAEHCFHAHWEELALDKVLPYDLNDEVYEKLEDAQSLHITAMREGSQIVGYFFAVLGPHLHYKSAGIMAYTDMYYVLPKYRVMGANLFMFTEATLRDRGVKKIYLSCKVHRNHSELFLKLGYKATDLGFSKFFGESETMQDSMTPSAVGATR